MLNFLKVEGLGNDFLLVDERDLGENQVTTPLALRQALCVRQSGVGADGVLTLLPSRSKDAFCRLHITNADGSVPQMCGNGLRCVAAALVHRGELADGETIHIDTDAGVLAIRAEGDNVVAEVGVATIGPENEELSVDASAGTMGVTGQRVSVGNPHFIVDGHPADATVARGIGPLVETHAAFPERTNVEFAHIDDDGSVHLVVWERGVGLTQACGTGACATVAAFANAKKVASNAFIAVHLPGGVLSVKAERLGEDPALRMWMRGPARVVFSGQSV